jgi:hypothetical protein
MAALAVNRAQIDVPHMHFFRCDTEGRITDLWQVWNTLAVARQLGTPAPILSHEVDDARFASEPWVRAFR